MAKFIEIHRIPLTGGEPFPQLLNLDDVSVACGTMDGTVITLRRREPGPMNGGSFRVAETYEELRALIASAQGGIPMGRADG